MPVALLPLSQYFLTTIVALLVIGGAAAGIAVRARHRRAPQVGAAVAGLPRRASRAGVGAAVAGLLAVQVVAVVQAGVVTRGVLDDSSASGAYLAVVLAVVVVSMLVSLLVMLLVALAPVPGGAIALAMAAIVAPDWVGAALRQVTLLGPATIVEPILLILRWMPAVLVGAVIAWCGFRTAGRVAAIVVSLAALWIGPAFFTGVSAAAGTRVLARYPAEMAEYGIQVFMSALTRPEIVLAPLMVAVVVGVLGRLTLSWARRARTAVPADEAA